ncbi:MAG: MarR family transcriptional regulator [Vicinamibacterales bacterium]
MKQPPGRLQRELRQRRPFVSVSDEAAVAILRTADVVRRFYGEVLAPFEITLPQYNVLRILRGAGDAGLPTLDVAARLIESAPGITLMMDRLFKRGWVRRRRARADRRQILCYLTAEGATLLEQIDTPFDAAHARVMGGMTARDCRTVIRLLERVRQAHSSPD